MITHSMVAHFPTIKNTFPKTVGIYATAGEFIHHNHPLKQNLIEMIQGTKDALSVNEVPAHPVSTIIHLLRTESLKGQLNPLIEALFMSMRGHNNNLMDPAEPNNQACTDGVYLNLMREIATVPALSAGAGSGAAAAMSAVTTVGCAQGIEQSI